MAYDVKNSVLYKTLCKQVRKEDHAELLRMLEFVEKSGIFVNWSNPWLSGAFTWHESPQGGLYWANLSNRMDMAGHPHW